MENKALETDERITPDHTQPGRMPMSQKVYKELLRRIMDTEWPVGTRIPSENELSEMFGASRPVIRDALTKLQSEGIIERRQGSGSRVLVSPPRELGPFSSIGNISDLIKYFEFRTAVEGDAAYLAADRRTEEDLKRLHDCFERTRASPRLDTLSPDDDFAYHLEIAKASKNDLFVNLMRLLEHPVKFEMNLSGQLTQGMADVERLAIVHGEHLRIFNAIAEKRPDEARDFIRSHLSASVSRIMGTGVYLIR